MTDTTADDSLRKLIYETYFSVPPRDRQYAEWAIKPQLWDEISKLQSRDTPLVQPIPGNGRPLLLGLPVHVDDLADWVELRSSAPTAQ